MIDAVDVLNAEIRRLRAATSAAEERATTLQRERDAALARVADLAGDGIPDLFAPAAAAEALRRQRNEVRAALSAAEQDRDDARNQAEALSVDLEHAREEVERLRGALEGCLDAMDMQEKRETGAYHIPSETALCIWRDAQATARALLYPSPGPAPSGETVARCVRCGRGRDLDTQYHCGGCYREMEARAAAHDPRHAEKEVRLREWRAPAPPPEGDPAAGPEHHRAPEKGESDAES